MTHSQSVRDPFNAVPTAVVRLGAEVDASQRGLVATSLSVGGSHKPPKVAVSILSRDQAGVLCQLAAKTGDRFAGLVAACTAGGALFLGGATSWMDCSIADVAVPDEHKLVVLETHCPHSSANTEPRHRSDFSRLEYAVAPEVGTRGD